MLAAHAHGVCMLACGLGLRGANAACSAQGWRDRLGGFVAVASRTLYGAGSMCIGPGIGTGSQIRNVDARPQACMDKKRGKNEKIEAPGTVQQLYRLLPATALSGLKTLPRDRHRYRIYIDASKR